MKDRYYIIMNLISISFGSSLIVMNPNTIYGFLGWLGIIPLGLGCSGLGMFGEHYNTSRNKGHGDSVK